MPEVSRPRTPSRRQRRILWTAAILCATASISAIVTWRIDRENAPEEYRPGEASADVTSNIAERASLQPAVAKAAPRIEVKERRVDPLRDPGTKIPRGAPEPRFTDVTAAAGLGSFRTFAGNRTSQLPEDMGSGAAWGDFDNDGNDDVFIVSAGGPLNAPTDQLAPSILYRNLGNGTFEPVRDFPQTRIHGMAAAWADVDNDGWLDLIVTGYDTIILFRNDHGHFTRDRRFPSPKGFWTGASWGDFDRDGKLDLYICGYVKYAPASGAGSRSSQQFGLEVPFTLNPASYEPERNLLFHNNGDGTFREVARQLGVEDSEGRSLSALWHDFDGDGWLDLYVANDISENKLYLNRHGHFVDAGSRAWIAEYRGSMGLAAGDFDRDGDDDLFISHWIAQQYALYQSLLSEQKSANTKAASELHFTDVAEMKGIGQPSMQSIGWGAAFADFDSDGWPDLVVANGSTFETKANAPRRLVAMPSFLFWNAGGEFFHDLAPWNRSLSQPHVSRGLGVADYNNDGAMDILIVDHDGGVRLLRNDMPHGNWAEFRLHSRVGHEQKPMGFGDGATVVAWVKGVPLRRSVTSASYLSQDSRRVHIGIGSARSIDRLDVHWLGGPLESWTNLDANRIWEITEGERVAEPFRPATPAPLHPTQRDTVRFWELQRAAMDAMKRNRDMARAAQLFREALRMDPLHEDSRYYLANCLVAQGDIPAALAELRELARNNPQSHRAFQREGELLATTARSKADLAAAQSALETALRINAEETGTLLLLGEVHLARGDMPAAQQLFAHACRTNPRAAAAFFLRGYIAWKNRDSRTTAVMLDAAAKARGPDWKPAGSVAEGEVKHSMVVLPGFLSSFEERWSGQRDARAAFAKLEAFLAQYHATYRR